MLSCKDITHLANQKLDREMPFFKRMQFNLHLMVCKNCRQFMDQMQLTLESIQRIEPIKPEPSVVNSQVSQLLELAQTMQQKK